MDISVVVPVYGCKAALPELYRRLTSVLIDIAKDYEIILVNDSCPQNSWEVIEGICSKDLHVKGVELSRNFGQMKAILAGLDLSVGDWVVVMDCDLQDRPEEIARLYRKALEGYDAVFARRSERNDNKLKSFFANQFYKVYRFATDANYDGAVCNFSILSRLVVDAYCSMREEHRGYVMYVNWLGFHTTCIDVERDIRFEGKSSYSFKKRVDLAIELLTSQSDKLLRISVGIGFAMTILSFFVIIGLAIYHYVADVTIGWTSIIASNFFIGGLIILTIGVVGIYVGNVFTQTKNRPLYVVRQILNQEQSGDEED